MHNVLGPRDLVSSPDNMGETVLHTDLGHLKFLRKNTKEVGVNKA